MEPRHIAFLTGKRGGFTHLIPIFEAMRAHDDLTHSIVAADMHLSGNFGNTVSEVEQWADRVYRIDTMFTSDSKIARAKSIGVGIMGFAQLLDEIRPDLVFALGDRGEVLGWVIAAMELNIPIVHIFGGDVTQGGVDEPVRHAITKMANLHLASNEQSARRIINMGEEPWRVHNVGSPVLDLVRQGRFTSAAETARKFDLDPDEPILVLLQHSVTWQVDQAEHQIRQTMEAIDQLGYQTVAIYPCSDPGYEQIVTVLNEYAPKSYLQAHRNIPFQDFWGLLNIADCFLGNSSAGVMETASFKLPFINIGIRQEDRLRAGNTLEVEHDKAAIIGAIEKALNDAGFKEQYQACRSPYGDGHAAERIVKVLREIPLDDKLLRKKITY